MISLLIFLAATTVVVVALAMTSDRRTDEFYQHMADLETPNQKESI